MDKTVLITGASRGIGAQTARRFAAAGFRVAVNYRADEAGALALCREIAGQGGAALPVRADVSDPEQAAGMVDTVLENFCQLDILVCNAGAGYQTLLSDMTTAQWRQVMGVNLDGVFYCCRAALPHMIHRKKGKIITVSSMWGVTGGSCEAAYSAAKAGVIGLTRALAKEVGPSGITVNCVAPGVIDTKMNENLGPQDLAALAEETPLGRIGTPADVAEAIFYLASPGADFVTGQVLQPNGGIVIG